VGKVFAAHSAVEVVEVFKFNVGKVSPFEKTIEATSVFVKYLGDKPRGFTVLSVSPEKWADGHRRI
jgi:hypothetical protein